MDRFKVDKITKYCGDYWTYEKRVSKCWFVMSITFGLVTVFTVAVIAYFFRHNMEYAWHASREAIERPGTEAANMLVSVFTILLYVIAGLGIIGLVCYMCRRRATDNREEAQINEVQLPDRKTTENNANPVGENDNEQPSIIRP